ncbi:2-oxoglutarate ferredoxin oxidoreductase subunit gamma [Desulfoluna limicola]|uniref:2-oxoglutarate ferredoxin oxidoreductase subunit gamma n=1 Tax=Desulfoluna limicola TaxID=2810562 RepID=A0ABM7PA47_9BACT|nr:2-oxoacid:acceptor oxidoreductase family protein [Desulfoluna limicola]BCS94484.1 2-oxoglutarate ferredoxin oxidoreductase subunit gamma [Desulfoluna limicola]
MEKFRMVFSGSGGQGVITAAIMMAEAAVIHEGLIAVQSQSYGAEARGGATRSDIIISDKPILFPKVTQPNVLVCLTQEAYDKFSPIIRPGGLLLADDRYVMPRKKVDAKQVNLPMYQTVMEKIGNPIVFNICMLGALIGLLNIVRTESVLAIIAKRVPEKYVEMNQQALDLGVSMAVPLRS